MGELYLRDLEDVNDWNEYTEARGKVAVPLGREVSLWVSSHAASDLSPLAVLRPDDLQVVEITCTKLDGRQLQHIQHLTGLRGLALWETFISDEAFLHVNKLTKMRWLDIGDTRITNEGLAFVQAFTFLEELTLLNTQISDQGIRHLEGLTNLKRLDLMGTQVSDDSFESLRGLTGLKSLRIVDTDISYPVYARLKRELPDCQIKYHEFART